jgi:hypothetical protein
MNFDQTPEFEKELKKLSKKYLSLNEDLSAFLKVVEALYTGSSTEKNLFQQAFFDGKRATRLTYSSTTGLEVVKARLDCAYLNSDKLRVIYIFQNSSVLLVEVYAKNVKAREDINRIKRYTQ